MERKTSLLQHTLTYGAILGVISIIFSLIMYISGYMPVGKNIWITGLISLIITILFISFGIKSYRDKVLDGNISYGQAFLTGFLIILFSSLISSLYTLIFNTLIDPEYMSRVLEASKSSTYDMLNNMGVPEGQIEESMEQFERRAAKMTPLRTFFTGLIWPLIIGSIISLIVAAFTKKMKNPIA